MNNLQYVIGTDFTFTTNNTNTITINNNNKMKEQKLTKQKVIFRKIVISEYEYNILAESHEDALKKISDGGYTHSVNVISEEIIEVK